MLASALRHYRAMILAGVFFFWLGCGLTVSLLRLECAEAARGGIGRGRAPEPPPTAAELDPLESVEYAVLVLSGPSNAGKREAVRKSWGTLVNNPLTDSKERLLRRNSTRIARSMSTDFVRVFFPIGTLGLSEANIALLYKEHERTNDLLILENFEDKYETLAGKMLESMKWLNMHLKNLKYVIKSDDDSFVRIDLIVIELDANGPNVKVPQLRKHKESGDYQGLYWGYFSGQAQAFHSGKFKEENWFLCDRYLPYALGGGYIISRSIVAYIATNADALSLYNSEDVTMGVWTAALRLINRVHDVRFDAQWKTLGCQNNMLVRHKQSSRDMIDLYNNLVNSKGQHMCKSETVEMKAYHYNWNVLPSKCCK